MRKFLFNRQFCGFLGGICLFSWFSLPALTERETAEVATRFAPEIRFHKDEKYFPSSVSWYAERASLKKRDGKNEILVLPQPITDVNVLANYPPLDYPQGYNEVNNYFLDLDKSDEHRKRNRAGMPIVNGKSTAPCYVHAKERSNGGLLLQYIFFYPYQGRTLPAVLPKKVGPINLDLGMHESDWEHVDVYLRKVGPVWHPEQVYFSAHGSKPHGELLPASKVTFIDQTHPVVYAARYGHASHSRNVGFDKDTLDSTSEGGVKWRCWENGVINVGDRENPAPGQRWILFGGRWGSTKEHEDKLITTHLNNSPTGPAIDNAWWRYISNQLTLILEIPAHAGSGRVSDYFDTKTDIIPTRTKTIKWQIDHPNADEFEFSVNEYKYLRSDKKNIGGRLHNGSITEVGPYKENNLYITDLHRKTGNNKESEKVIIKMWGIEE